MDYYGKNIEVLKRLQPELVGLIESTAMDDHKIEVLYSESGEPRLLYKKEDGEEIYIHNAEDPVKAAADVTDLVSQRGDEGIIILFGFGLGYFAEEAIKKFEKSHMLIVYEATPALFKAALNARDISALLESNKIKIILGENPSNLSVIHNYYDLIHNGKFLVVKHHPSVKLNADAYAHFFELLTDENILAKTQIITGLSRGREFIDADIENIPIVIRKNGVRKLKDIFKGRPAVVVSAGPSLDKNFHLLKEIKGKAVIVAVDAAIATLLPCGILPDMVLAVEPSKKTMHMFKDTPLLKNVPLVALQTFQTDIYRYYPGPVFINSMPGSPVSILIKDCVEDKGYIPVSGGSVAHFAFSTAEYMGCNPIALIGQDLSFNRERFHSKGFAEILDMLVMDAAIPTQNIFGEDIYTRSDLSTYKLSFERKIEEFDGTVVNATEGGLPIKGAVNMRFSDFIEEYCGNVPEKDLFSVLSDLADDQVTYNLEGILFTLKNTQCLFKELKKKAQRILKCILGLKKLQKIGEEDSREFHESLDKIESLIDQFRHPALNLLVGYNYKLELYLKKKDIREIDDIVDKREKLEKQLERGEKYYQEIVDTINPFLQKFNGLILEMEREKKVNAILTDKTMEREERFYRTGMIYKKAEMPAQAAKYLEQVSESQGGKGVEAGISLAEMYLKQFRFYEVMELLDKVRKIKSRRLQQEKIHELSILCDQKIKGWEERKNRMTELLESAENNYGGVLESGYFYFRLKEYDKAEKTYLKAIQENPLSSAYYGLAHTYLAVSDPEKAVDFLEKAIEVDPQNPILYRDIGYIAFQNNNFELAEMFFTKAIACAPNTADLYQLLADLYIARGEVEKAIFLYEGAVQANPDHPLLQRTLATLYREVVANTGRA